MEISPLQLAPVEAGEAQAAQALGNLPKAVEAQEGKSFQDLLAGAIDKTNQMSLQADNLIKKFAAGDPVELHQVMIAVEKANLSLQMTMQVRNKILDAYQQIMNMQI